VDAKEAERIRKMHLLLRESVIA